MASLSTVLSISREELEDIWARWPLVNPLAPAQWRHLPGPGLDPANFQTGGLISQGGGRRWLPRGKGNSYGGKSR